jgi:diaminopimelate decarboxylase
MYGTPLYVYDAAMLVDNYRIVCQALPQFEVFYALKANPSLALCTLFHKQGAGAELASGGELKLALKADFPPAKIVFAGPAKTDIELAQAVEAGIASVNVESFAELARLEAVARRMGKRVNASLRINTKQSDVATPEVMVGAASRFGIDEEKVLDELDRLQGLDYVHLSGIHVYTASQILEVEAVIRNLIRTLTFASTLAEQTAIPLARIVFGGGFGVPYAPDVPVLDMARLSIRVDETLKKFAGILHETRLIVELGRYLVARAGVFLTRVVDVKHSRGKQFVATDGGMNHFFRPVLMNLNHPTFIVNKLKMPETETVNIGGPLCTPIDIIANEVRVPAVEAGDLVGFFNAGAYGFSMSLLDFLAHPRPAEVLVQDAEPYLIRERGTFEDIVRHQRVPPIR